MDGRYLITQSLLSAFNYVYDCYEGSEQSAYDDFLRVLRREPTETTEAMQHGISFEDEVIEYAKCNRCPMHRQKDVREIGDIVRGGQFQVKGYKDKTIAGINFLLYAKCDIVKMGEIFDIKRSNTYEVGKYMESAQHPMYMECVPAFKFTYLISDGKDVFKESYTREETPSVDIMIGHFIDFLRHNNLLDLYFEKWRAA